MSVTWQYRASTSTGALVEGEVRAASHREALEELRRQSLVPMSLAAGGSAVAAGRRFGSREDALAAGMRTLAALVSGGATLDRALQFASTHATDARVAASFAESRADVVAGQSLSASWRRQEGIVGLLAIALARTGEESGQLGAALERLADHMDEARELRSRLRGALLYPAILGLAAGVGVVVLLAFVVPRFVDMLDASGATLPLSTRLLVAASGMATSIGWILVPVVIAGGMWLRWWLRTPANRARWDAMRLRLPVAGPIEWRLWTARFSRTLGTLLEGGTPMLASLRIAREGVGNSALGTRLDAAVQRVQRGDRLGAALEGVLPPLAVQLLATGEESATLPAMAKRVADAFDGDVQRALRQAVGLLEPVLIVLFGGLAGFIALAMLQAMYSINASVL